MHERGGPFGGVPRRPLLAIAGGIWLAVGLALATAGAWWIATRGNPLSWGAVPLALVAGWAKARWVLRPMARRNVERLAGGPERLSVLRVFPARTWAMAAGFMTLGAILRRSGFARDRLGLVYLAVGLALVAASEVSIRACSGPISPRS